MDVVIVESSSQDFFGTGRCQLDVNAHVNCESANCNAEFHVPNPYLGNFNTLPVRGDNKARTKKSEIVLEIILLGC